MAEDKLISDKPAAPRGHVEGQRITNNQTPLGSAEEEDSRLELIRVVLDFIAKCFYPGIVIAVLVLLHPMLQQVDLPALFGRLHSAKVGDYEFNFDQAEKVGAETAPLNRKIAELEFAVSGLRNEVGILSNKTGITPINATQAKELAAQEHNFKANAQYTALVFHRRESRTTGESVTKALLSAGFVSSDTETDFSELQKIQPTPGVIFITYNAAGGQVLSDVKSLIEKLELHVEVKTNPRPIDLRRGDLQILVF